MPLPYDSRKNGQPSTYFVGTKDQKDELTRLTIQDRMLTSGMGGPLAEQATPLNCQKVLDVGCGPGAWLLEVAQSSAAQELIGIDISQQMIDYGSTQATRAHLSERVSFLAMDALQTLAFPNAAFDLVNMRLGSSYLRTWDWPRVLGELMRVTRPGGTMRLVDTENGHQSNSRALTAMFALFANALFQAGHSFTDDRTGLVAHLPRLLAQYGYTDIQTKISALEFRTGTPQGRAYYKNLVHMQNVRFFVQKWDSTKGDFDALYQQALQDAQQSDFVATWTIHTIWGIRP